VEAKPIHDETDRAVTPASERDALLGRLRARAKTLDETAVRRILEQRRRHA